MNNTIPLGGLRNDIGKLFNPHMKELNKGWSDTFRNRNLIFEYGPGADLPTKYDMLNGKPIQSYNFFTRAFNAVSPIQINLDKGEKNILINKIKDMKNNSKNSKYKVNDASWTGDTQGHEYLHKDLNFNNLFVKINEKIENYLDFLKVDKNQIETYISRSWATISSGKEVISKHQHLQSHVSFAYYLKKISSDSNFIVYDEEKKNEFIPGLFGSKTLVQKKLIKEITLASATKISLPVNEDDIVIFPSKTLHSTDQIKTNNDRISISGDIIFLAKDTNTLEHLTPSFENWKKL